MLAIFLALFAQVDWNYDDKVDLRDAQVRQLMEPRTTDDIDSWLFIYNSINEDSVNQARRWKGKKFGLPLSSMETITRTEYIETIAEPLREYFQRNPEINADVLALVVGYRVPGDYWAPDALFRMDLPALTHRTKSGWSVANSLCRLNDDDNWWVVRGGTIKTFPTVENPNYDLQQRPTRINLGPGQYVVVRMDAIERRFLRTISKGSDVCFDYRDPGAPIPIWHSLQEDIQSDWVEYDSDGPAPSNCLFQLSYYRLDWGNYDWTRGSIGYAHNSFGAISVRYGTRFVPLCQQYMESCIGATAEPMYDTGPRPGILVDRVQRGWPIWDAFYVSNRWQQWMWTLFTDVNP